MPGDDRFVTLSEELQAIGARRAHLTEQAAQLVADTRKGVQRARAQGMRVAEIAEHVRLDRTCLYRTYDA